MSEWIGDTAVSDVGWNHLETLVDIGNRLAGSEGEWIAARRTQAALERVGAAAVRIESFDIQGWERGTSAIEVADTTQECIALPRSPSGAISGRLVDIGHGLPSDFERELDGAIVLASSDVPEWYDRYIHRREKYYRAVAAGAAGFIYSNHISGCLPPTGSVGTDDDPIGDVPAVGVSKEIGARLGRRWDADRVTLRVKAETPPATSPNVQAELGPDTDREVLVTAHLDAHDIAEGAMDNGAGTAMVVEIASALVAREAELDTGVRFVVFGSEEVGLLGSVYDASQRDPESVKAVINNDGVVRARTLKLETNGFDGLAHSAEVVADRLGHPVTVSPKMAPHSDHWPYVRRGVPGVHVQSETGGADRGWGHTAADTLDKLDRRDLREQALLLTEFIVEVARNDTELDRRSTDEIAAQLEAEDLAPGMRVIGDWPF